MTPVIALLAGTSYSKCSSQSFR